MAPAVVVGTSAGSTAPSGCPDRSAASLLADAAERLHAAIDLSQLWTIAAQEALWLIEADGALVVDTSGWAWRLLGAAPDTARAEAEGIGVRWCSLLVVPISPVRRPETLRLVWFAEGPSCLASRKGLARILAWQVSLAAMHVDGVRNLQQATDARHRVVGQPKAH